MPCSTVSQMIQLNFPTSAGRRGRLLSAVYLLACVFLLGVASCSDAPPDDDCPDGVCDEAACSPDECSRGVCEPETGCVNADDCAGDDGRCLADFYCADDDTCQPDPGDLCADRPTCTRGECDPDTGDCRDAPSCEASTDCLAGSRCLDGACTPEEFLCGESGCPQDRTCIYSENTLSAECAESVPCETTRECFEGRVCAGNHCVSAPVCEPDVYEDNDDRGDATDFDLVAQNGAVDATLCADDTDVYRVEVGSPEDVSHRRELRMVVQIPRREVGLGPVSATIETPGDESPVTKTTDEEGRLVIEYPLTLSNTGDYHVRVEPAGGEAGGGLHYRLAAQVQPRNLGGICESAQPIEPGDTIAGDTSGPSTTLLDSRCNADEPGATDLYALQVDRPSRVDVRLTADSPEDFVVGLRSECRRLDTELVCAAGEQSRFGNTHRVVDVDEVVVEPGQYIIGVHSPRSSGAGPYELDVQARPLACSPAENSCTDDLSWARVCEPLGDGAGQEGWDSRPCPRGCEPHTGSCRPQPADTCDDAPMLTESATIQLDWDDYSADYRIPDGGCLPVLGGSTQTDGPDAVYRVPLPPDHGLTGRLTADDVGDVSLYLIEDCLAPAQLCIAGANEDPDDDDAPAEQLTHWNTGSTPQTVFLVADATERVSGTAELDIEVGPILCETWESRCHEGDVQRCSSTRTSWETSTECQWGCTNAGCDPPPGDTCAEADPLSSGDTITDVFSDYSDSADSDIEHCVEFGSLDYRGTGLDWTLEGPDAFYTVDLNQGDLLTAELITDATAGLFVAESCQPRADQSCLAGDISTDNLQFYAPEAGQYYLGVESLAYDEDAEFELSVDVQSNAAVCRPGGTYCDPATDELVVCNEQGTREQGRRQCPNGCGPQGCEAPATVNDTCDTAYQVSASTRIVEDLDRFSDNFSATSSCHTNPQFADEADAVYAIDLDADEVLTATAKGVYGYRPNLYIATDCDDVEATCAAGSPGGSSTSPSEVTYHADSPETVYLIAERYGRGPIQLDIDIRPVECSHGQTRCAATGDLDYCSDRGLWEQYTCDGGCNNGACNTPTGGICQDAIAVSDGQTVTGDWTGQNDVELGGEAGACGLSGAMGSIGADTFYRVDLAQGDLLEVDMQTTHPDATVHFLDSCTGLNSCSSGDHYYAEQDGPVWVMVDTSRVLTMPGHAPTYSLTFDVTSGAVCAPSTRDCIDSQTVGVCNSEGTAFETTYDCPNLCERGGCQADPATADQCTSAPDVGDGILVYADPADLSDDVPFTDSACVPYPEERRDLIYEVTVEAGEVLYTEATNAFVALVDDCGDSSGSCVDTSGPKFSGSADTGISWAPEQTETVKVVAEVLTVDQPVSLQIDTWPVECTAGQRQCAPDGEAVQFCESHRRWKTVDCNTTCSNGRCDAPSGQTCYDALPISSGASVGGSFDDGDSVVYEIELQEDDLLDARLLGTSDTSVSLLQDCAQSPSAVRQTISQPDSRLEYYAQSSGTYHLVVAEGSSYNSGGNDFALEVDVHPGRACQPNTSRCTESTGIAEVCNDRGTAYDDIYHCALGCNDDADACARPEADNDTCADPMVIDEAIVFSDSFGDYTDDYNNFGHPNSCTTTSLRAGDSVYQVDLDAGEVLRASITTEASAGVFGTISPSWPHLIVSDTCADQAGTCLATSEEQATGDYDSAEVTYRASSPETVYLTVDAEYNRHNDFRLEVDISQATCSPGNTRCVDADTLETCLDGRPELRACEFGCVNAACNPAPNDTCGGATAIPRDGEFHTKELYMVSDYTDSLDMGAAINPACSSWGTHGADAIYELDAEQGDVLTAYWTGLQETSVWLTGDCSNAADECMLDERNGFLEQVIPADGTYWLVLDHRDPPQHEPTTLDVRLAPTICQPGEATCDGTTGIITYCNDTGTDYKDYACQGGCDTTNGQPHCDEPRGEQCVDAVDIGQGASFMVDVQEFDNTFAPPANSCIERSTTGGDAIYRVDLSAGDTVEATVEQPYGEVSSVYILEDCHTPSPEDVCVAGDFAFSAQTAETSYTATADQTVYVVVDSSDSQGAGLPFAVDISVQ